MITKNASFWNKPALWKIEFTRVEGGVVLNHFGIKPQGLDGLLLFLQDIALSFSIRTTSGFEIFTYNYNNNSSGSASYEFEGDILGFILTDISTQQESTLYVSGEPQQPYGMVSIQVQATFDGELMEIESLNIPIENATSASTFNENYIHGRSTNILAPFTADSLSNDTLKSITFVNRKGGIEFTPLITRSSHIDVTEFVLQHTNAVTWGNFRDNLDFTFDFAVEQTYEDGSRLRVYVYGLTVVDGVRFADNSGTLPLYPQNTLLSDKMSTFVPLFTFDAVTAVAQPQNTLIDTIRAGAFVFIPIDGCESVDITAGDRSMTYKVPYLCDNGEFLRWADKFGMLRSYRFNVISDNEDGDETDSYILLNSDLSQTKVFENRTIRKMTLGTPIITADKYNVASSVIGANNIERYNKELDEWQVVRVTSGTAKKDVTTQSDFQFEIEL